MTCFSVWQEMLFSCNKCRDHRSPLVKYVPPGEMQGHTPGTLSPSSVSYHSNTSAAWSIRGWLWGSGKWKGDGREAHAHCPSQVEVNGRCGLSSIGGWRWQPACFPTKWLPMSVKILLCPSPESINMLQRTHAGTPGIIWNFPMITTHLASCHLLPE